MPIDAPLYEFLLFDGFSNMVLANAMEPLRDVKLRTIGAQSPHQAQETQAANQEGRVPEHLQRWPGLYVRRDGEIVDARA